MKKNRIVLAGAFGTGNLGDDSILCGVLSRLKKESKIRNSDILVFSRDPKWIKSLCNVPSVRKNFRDLVVSDEVIIGGGEMFSDVANMALKYAILGLVAKFLRKKVFFNAVGVQKLRLVSRFFMWLAFTFADEVTVRSLQSQNNLLELHLSKKVELVKDSAFYVEPVSKEEASVLLENIGIKLKDNRFIIGLTSQYIFDKKLRDKTYAFLIQLLKKVLETNEHVYIVFVPFCDHVDSKVQRDIFLGEFLQKQLNSKRFKIVEAKHSPWEIMGMFGLFDLVISTRMHPLIFGVKMSIPTLGVGVFNKIRIFCAEQHLKILEIDELEQSLNSVESIISHRQEKTWAINDVGQNNS